MRSKFLKKTGLSDPDFFYGEEDIELSHRFKKFGGQNLCRFRSKNLSFSITYCRYKLGKNYYYNYKYRFY
jgi:hypothetical protein